MPIYEYRCESCGHEQEAIQKFSDDPLTRCDACSEQALKRLISKSSFHLKGSGWYVTDYKGGARNDAKPPSTETASTVSAPAVAPKKEATPPKKAAAATADG